MGNLQTIISLHKGVILKTAALLTAGIGYVTNSTDCMLTGMALYQSSQNM